MSGRQQQWKPMRLALLLLVGMSVGSAFVVQKSLRPSKRPFVLVQQSSTKTYDDSEERSYWRIWKTTPSIVDTAGASTKRLNLSRTLSSDGSAAIALKRGDLLPARAVEAISLFYKTITDVWWLSPILLCFVPLISQLFFSTLPATPEVWKLVNLPALCQNNAYFVAGFLASNLSYLASAVTLGTSRRFSPAGWVLAAGLVSSAFHTIQTFGTYSLAEAWCYLDHGVAITAILYFWRTFGLPSSKLFWGTTFAGLLALVAPTGNNGKIYTVLHSLWHVCSASAAVLWALEHRPRKSSP